ncbi:MAG: Hly-III family protein [Rhodospirillales bacterium]|jgi:hemolysin III|nr:Hly-III family protein [Rhodospirillales bacterium]
MTFDRRASSAMASTFPTAAARRVNRLLVTLTLWLSAAALLALVVLAATALDRRRAAVGVVYGATLVACSLCSYLYNMHETTPRRRLLRTLDHSAIFLLIAGTYTPFAAHGIAGPFGVGILEWIWGLAGIGIVLKLTLGAAYDSFFVALYLAMGWLVLSAFDQFTHGLSSFALVFLALGGAAYTIGALIYARGIGRWTDPVWHGFVLAGIATHFCAVAALLLGPGAV